MCDCNAVADSFFNVSSLHTAASLILIKIKILTLVSFDIIVIDQDTDLAVSITVNNIGPFSFTGPIARRQNPSRVFLLLLGTLLCRRAIGPI